MVGTYRPNILLNCAEMKVTNNSDSLQYSVMCKKKVLTFPKNLGGVRSIIMIDMP